MGQDLKKLHRAASWLNITLIFYVSCWLHSEVASFEHINRLCKIRDDYVIQIFVPKKLHAFFISPSEILKSIKNKQIVH